MGLFAGIGVVFSVFLLFSTVEGQVEMDEPRAKAIATELVRQEMGLRPSHLLRATRREDWEDYLFRLQITIRGQIAKAAYFFEITETGSFVISPDEAVDVTTNDGHHVWTVAVSRTEDIAYGLYGFRDGDAEFNRLMSDARVAIRSEDNADMAALLLFRTLKDPRERNLVFYPRQLKRRVEDYFLFRIPKRKAEARASAWWRGFTAARISEHQLGIRSTPTTDGYVTSVTHVRSTDRENIELVALELTISSTGRCETRGTRIIYPSPGRK